MSWLALPRRLVLQALTAGAVTLLAVLVSVPLAALTTLRFLVRALRSPSVALRGPAPRTAPPACLQDPQLGQHAFITLPKGIKLHYVENGDSSRPLLLLLHGFPEFWYSWKNQLQEFAKDYWVVAVDMRGCGESDKPSRTSSYRADVLVDDVKELLDAFERPRATLVGHGWGGVVGWLFLERYPERVQRLVALGAPHPVVFQQALVRNRRQLTRSWYLFLFQVPWLPELLLKSEDFACLSVILRRGPRQPPAMSPEELEAYKYTFGQPGALTGPINYYRAAGWGVHRRTHRPTSAEQTAADSKTKQTANGHVTEPKTSPDPEPLNSSKEAPDDASATTEAPSTEKSVEDTAATRSADSTTAASLQTPPVLLLLGDHDAYVQHSTAFRTRKFFPNVSVVIIRQANHFVQLDDPQVVNAAMRKFFES